MKSPSDGLLGNAPVSPTAGWGALDTLRNLPRDTMLYEPVRPTFWRPESYSPVARAGDVADGIDALTARLAAFEKYVQHVSQCRACCDCSEALAFRAAIDTAHATPDVLGVS